MRFHKAIEIIKMIYAVGLVGYAWYGKWLDTHPRPIGELTETDAEIHSIRYRRRLLHGRENDPADIAVLYQNEKGKQIYAQLASVPLRKQLEQFAPELQAGEKIHILYEKKHPNTFYFADPRYAAPEVSGEPRRHIRAGWPGLIAATILLIALLVFDYFLYRYAQNA